MVLSEEGGSPILAREKVAPGKVGAAQRAEWKTSVTVAGTVEIRRCGGQPMGTRRGVFDYGARGTGDFATGFASCWLRTFAALARHFQQRVESWRKPSSKVTVTHSVERSHQTQVASGCQSVSVTCMWIFLSKERRDSPGGRQSLRPDGLRERIGATRERACSPEKTHAASSFPERRSAHFRNAPNRSFAEGDRSILGANRDGDSPLAV